MCPLCASVLVGSRKSMVSAKSDPHFCLPSSPVLASSEPSPLGDDLSQGRETGRKGVALGKHASQSSGPLVPCTWHRPHCPVSSGAITGQAGPWRPPRLWAPGSIHILASRGPWEVYVSLSPELRRQADSDTLVTERAHPRNPGDQCPVGVPDASGTSLRGATQAWPGS